MQLFDKSIATLTAIAVVCLASLSAPGAALASEASEKFELGDELLRRGSADSAVFFFDKCLKLNPYYWKAYLRRGDALNKLGEKYQAKLDYQEALKINPQCSEAKKKLSALSGRSTRKKKTRSHSSPDTQAKKESSGLSRSTAEGTSKGGGLSHSSSSSKSSGLSRSRSTGGVAPPTSKSK
ncbi:MAG: tetratricopeptide repeat protein [Candidatus Obscuribacterales bacterium]